MYDMENTLTVRVPREQNEALARLARSRNTTVSAVVRALLDQSLSGLRTGGFASLAGAITSEGQSRAPFRATIRERNIRG
jgi:predicted DNA-binding protein